MIIYQWTRNGIIRWCIHLKSVKLICLLDHILLLKPFYSVHTALFFYHYHHHHHHHHHHHLQSVLCKLSKVIKLLEKRVKWGNIFFSGLGAWGLDLKKILIKVERLIALTITLTSLILYSNMYRLRSLILHESRQSFLGTFELTKCLPFSCFI